ncbi:hypothetical protein [Ornithinibacillus scapharcae]|uniref:hypothetical protein n=1 Tax=Ornithinibacillus scapharcae TaxID=1147159 RepID=UPI000225AB4B|nr:hypothetical protein [Ornithinibacillus scapharcae]
MKNTKLINQYKDNEISWFWTYYDLVQAGKNVSEDEIKIINDRLNIFEKSSLFLVYQTKFIK